MKLKNSFFYTIRENAKDEESISGNLLVRAGMIKKSSNGIYMMMPMGQRTWAKVCDIVRDEMNKAGAQELHMPALIMEEVYEKSGRREAFGSNMFSLKDRYQKKYVLGPTHEELFAQAGMMHGKSYKDFPYNLYQIQTKYRDETRPRFGLIRTREFTMKDAYSYDIDIEGMDKSYQLMFDAYKNIFDRLKLDYKIVKADTGAMGGLLSEEFQALAPIGEDIVVTCEKCGFASNLEVTPVVEIEKAEESFEKLSIEEKHTPNAKTIDEVAEFFGKTPNDFVKTLIYNVDGKLYAFLLKGNRELNESKVQKLLKANTVELASFEDVERVTNAKVGFAGPVGLDIDIIMDQEVRSMHNFICGANKTDYHLCNVNLSDFECTCCADIAQVSEGDVCPHCGEKLSFERAIEVGNTFKLGTKYSETMGLKYLDQNNQLQLVEMGCYGIGIERCMAAVVEQSHDENGIIWPMSIAPYQVSIVVVSTKDEEQMDIANKLYDEMTAKGIEVILDDRNERVGVKFKDSELVGIPLRITVGKGIKEGKVEFKHRKLAEKEDVLIEEVIEKIERIIEEELR